MIYERAARHDADARVFAVEYLPGQFDQRADSAAQCIQLIGAGRAPDGAHRARSICCTATLTTAELRRKSPPSSSIPSRRREAVARPRGDAASRMRRRPRPCATLEGFTALDDEALVGLIRAVRPCDGPSDDIAFCQRLFPAASTAIPRMTELRMIDTYWSDHCRHTTFLTTADRRADSRTRGVQAAYEHYLAMRRRALGRHQAGDPDGSGDHRREGADEGAASSTDLDESEEINACTIKINVRASTARRRTWLLHVQKRDPQPSHRDRAVRRRGHLHRRRHPRPAVRPQLCLSGACA